MGKIGEGEVGREGRGGEIGQSGNEKGILVVCEVVFSYTNKCVC